MKHFDNKFNYMTRTDALNDVIKNIDNKAQVVDMVTLFGFSAEDMLEAGASYEDVMALGGLVS